MTDNFAEKLFSSIKNDDIKAFDELNSQSPCAPVCFGRFPILSVMYLFSSRKLIKKYEDKFIRNSARKELPELTDISSAFRKKAGKCLRLYAEETVSPLEMLLILDKTAALKRIYPSARPSSAVKARLKTVYSIKYGLNLDFDGEEIVMERRPLTRFEKRRLITAVISSVLCIAVAVGTPFIVNAFVPFIGVGAPSSPDNPTSPDNPSDGSGDSSGDNSNSTDKKYYTVSSASEINFASNNTYTLATDITFPDDYYAETMSCVLDGDGKTITISGKKPLFGTVSGTIKNVAVNCVVNTEISEDFAFITERNIGTIENVTLNVSGKLTAKRAEQDENFSLVAAGIAIENGLSNSIITAGRISSCTANYDLTLEGNLYANATFGGIVGINYARVTDCSSSGSISADTFDAAGICTDNAYSLSGCYNYASIKQTASADGWSPMISGIAVNNYYSVSYCRNNGELVSESPATLDVYVGGIVATNHYSVSYSVNSAHLTAKSAGGTAYVGGIISRSFGTALRCLNDGLLSAECGVSCVGGITGFAGVETVNGDIRFGQTGYCISRGNISVVSENRGFVGGVIGSVDERLYNKDTENEAYYGGGSLYSYFTGAITSVGENVLCGGIVGVCGKNIYEKNSYSDNKGNTYYNFASNYYKTDCGATVAIKSVSEVVDEETTYTDGGNLGSTGVSVEEILNSENYVSTLQSLSSLLETDETA